MHVLINNSGDVEPKKIGSHLGLQTLSSTDEIFPAQVTEIHVAGCDGLAQAHPIPQPKRTARMTSDQIDHYGLDPDPQSESESGSRIQTLYNLV